MSNILIINAHHYYRFAEGKLNGTLVQMADELLTADGHQTKIVEVDKGWDVDQELENHQWADIILLQTPVNWMGVPWSFKKYMDEVYTAGMGGALCNGDGLAAPKKHPRRIMAMAAHCRAKNTCSRSPSMPPKKPSITRMNISSGAVAWTTCYSPCT